jgi:regulator of sigma D
VEFKEYDALKAFVAYDALIELEAQDALNELDENVDAGELSAYEAVIAFSTYEAVAAYELETAFKIYDAVTALLAHEDVPVNGPINEGAVIEFKAVVEPDISRGPDFKSIVPHNVWVSPPSAPIKFDPEVNAVEDVII